MSPTPAASRPTHRSTRACSLASSPARDRRDDEGDDRDREVARAPLERRVPYAVLHVERDVEEESEARARDRERREPHAGEGADPEKPSGNMGSLPAARSR